MLEEDVAMTLAYHDSTAGTTAVLLNASILVGPVNLRSFCAKTGTRLTHEVKFMEQKVCVCKQSNVTVPEEIPFNLLSKYKSKQLQYTLLHIYQLPKPPLLIVDANGYRNKRIITNSTLDDKSSIYKVALIAAGGLKVPPQTTQTELQPSVPPAPQTGWARYPGNNAQTLPVEVMQKLNKLYLLGACDKKWKVLAERACQIINNNVTHIAWNHKVIISVAKLKTFFQTPPAWQSVLIRKLAPAMEHEAEFVKLIRQS